MTLDDKKKRAEALEKAQNYDEAIEVWKEIVGESPIANSWWGYGKALYACNRTDESIAAYREVLKLAPSFKIGWACLADAYLKAKKPDEAEKAALQAIRLDREYRYPYSLIADIRAAGKNWAGCVEILTQLHKTGHASGHDLNRLGNAHLNLSQHGEAIRFYQLAIKAEPSPYPLFNLGLTYERIGQRLDALDAYQRSLRIQKGYDAALKELARVQKELIQVDNGIAVGSFTLPREDWYRHYLNPFELLGVDKNEDVSNLDVKKLSGLKKRVLHGIALDDGKAETLSGHTVDASIVEAAYKELLDEKRRDHHWAVFRNERLLTFLARGDVRHFLFQDGQTPFETIDKIEGDPDFRHWLSETFAKQYDQVLGNHLKLTNAAVVEALLDGRRWTEPESDDICFERAHRIVADLVKPLKLLQAEAETKVPQIESIRKIVIGDPKAEERLKMLSKLPVQFQGQIVEIVAAIRSIAIDCHNKHGQSALSYEILKIGQRLPTRDSKLSDRIKEDAAAIDKIVKEEAASRFEALIHKNRVLRITKAGVEYGGSFVRSQDVRSLAWGIYIHRVNGIETQHNYSISIGGANGGLAVSWDCDGMIKGFAKKIFRDKESTIPVSDLDSGQQDAIFGKIVDSLFNTVGTALLGHILTEFDAGRSMAVGNCTLSKQGATFQTGLIFKDRHEFPWSELDTASGNGNITLLNRFKRSISISFNAKTTANAVIVPPLCRIMRK